MPGVIELIYEIKGLSMSKWEIYKENNPKTQL